jgi:hypothetical protein
MIGGQLMGEMISCHEVGRSGVTGLEFLLKVLNTTKSSKAQGSLS